MVTSEIITLYPEDISALNQVTLFSNDKKYALRLARECFKAPIKSISLKTEAGKIIRNPTIDWKEPIDNNCRAFYQIWLPKLIAEYYRLYMVVYDKGQKVKIFKSSSNALNWAKSCPELKIFR